MKTFRIYSLILILTTSLLSFAKGGHDSVGGHSVRLIENGPLLMLDLALKNPQLDDPQTVSPEIPNLGRPGVLGLQDTKAENLPIFSKLQERLIEWEKFLPLVPPGLIALTRDIDLRVTDLYLPVDESFEVNLSGLKAQYPQAKLWKGISYVTNLGALLSMPVWKKSGDLSQMAYLVHEGFRNLQLYQNDKVSDEKIFELTAILVLDKPSEESAAKIIALLPDTMKLDLKILKLFRKYRTEACQTVWADKYYYSKKDERVQKDLKRFDHQCLNPKFSEDTYGDIVNFYGSLISLSFSLPPKISLSIKIEKLISVMKQISDRAQVRALDQWMAKAAAFMKGGNPFMSALFNDAMYEAGKPLIEAIKSQTESRQLGAPIP